MSPHPSLDKVSQRRVKPPPFRQYLATFPTAAKARAILRQGLTLGGFPLCPCELGVGPVEGRRPGDGPVFRVSEIDHDAVLPLFDRHTKTPVLFCANSSLGRPHGGRRVCAEFNVYIYNMQ